MANDKGLLISIIGFRFGLFNSYLTHHKANVYISTINYGRLKTTTYPRKTDWLCVLYQLFRQSLQ